MESRRAKFRRVNKRSEAPTSPRSLFRDLDRSADVPFLWSHQDRVLEGYEEKHTDSKDIALELPTGTGKSLIGLLIGEWRRRARQERVLYLCPTRQLAHQVGLQAERYGIAATVCLQPDYVRIADWQRGERIAIGTYASLFNYNPRFTAPQTLILDDAHAAETYVADHWTVKIDRFGMPDAYRELTGLLEPMLDPGIVATMNEDTNNPDRRAVDVVPLPRWWGERAVISDVVARAVESTDEWYAWDHHIESGLSACNIIVSWRAIVIRPLVPATAYQEEFAAANQRLYMSATLGAGGELERIFGVRRIDRLPVPEDSRGHSTGRRLFLMPTASLGQDEIDSLVARAIEKAGRALILAPTSDGVEQRRAALALSSIPTLGASDVEASLDPFITSEHAALVLANRYDGIDLPGNDCRLVVLDGLPVAVDYLERFLYQRLAATGLLNARMRTRLTQGVGRATRGEGDWCAVIVGSREAYDFCARTDVRKLLHPDLQGELEFGLAQSGERTDEEILGLLDIMLEHGDEWKDADAQVRELRDAATVEADPAARSLQEAVPFEVDFTYAMWEGDYLRALQKAGEAADELSGEGVAPYRAWWLYQGGVAAWLGDYSFGEEGMQAVAREHFTRAAAAGRSVSWFAELAYGRLGDGALGKGQEEISADDLAAAERLQHHLATIGLFGGSMHRHADSLVEDLAGTDSKRWESALERLGKLLGFDASRPDGNATPDSVWLVSSDLVFVWEAKSEEGEGEIGARTAQQAAGHITWVRENYPLSEGADIVSIVAIDRDQLADGAEIHAKDLYLFSLDEVRDLARKTLGAVQRIRVYARGADQSDVRTRILAEFERDNLVPSLIRAVLTLHPAVRE
jgi:DEAD/DEAH box helicase